MANPVLHSYLFWWIFSIFVIMAEVGRPTKYDEAHNKKAYKLSLLGATDIELADFFEVSEDTIYEWKKVHPEFSEAIKRGKNQADSEVANKLYKRATGYQHEDVDIKMFEGQIIQTPLVKHYPPDTTAAIFWLKNRQPKKWRDKQDIDHTTNGDNINTLLIEIVPPTETDE